MLIYKLMKHKPYDKDGYNTLIGILEKIFVEHAASDNSKKAFLIAKPIISNWIDREIIAINRVIENPESISLDMIIKKNSEISREKINKNSW